MAHVSATPVFEALRLKDVDEGMLPLSASTSHGHLGEFRDRAEG